MEFNINDVTKCLIEKSIEVECEIKLSDVIVDAESTHFKVKKSFKKEEPKDVKGGKKPKNPKANMIPQFQLIAGIYNPKSVLKLISGEPAPATVSFIPVLIVADIIAAKIYKMRVKLGNDLVNATSYDKKDVQSTIANGEKIGSKRMDITLSIDQKSSKPLYDYACAIQDALKPKMEEYTAKKYMKFPNSTFIYMGENYASVSFEVDFATYGENTYTKSLGLVGQPRTEFVEFDTTTNWEKKVNGLSVPFTHNGKPLDEYALVEMFDSVIIRQIIFESPKYVEYPGHKSSGAFRPNVRKMVLERTDVSKNRSRGLDSLARPQSGPVVLSSGPDMSKHQDIEPKLTENKSKIQIDIPTLTSNVNGLDLDAIDDL